MSEITRGAIGMPFELAMSSELSRRQFHSIAQALLKERDQLEGTIANQAQMIEHLRGGLTTPTSIDVANADADGFKNGRKSVGLLLGKGFNTLEQSGGKYSIKLSFQNADDAYAAYTEIAMVVRLAGEK